MSHATIVNRSQLVAAAAAISAAGIVGVPSLAQADPMFPLAPACSLWSFDGDLNLIQSNEYRVSVNTTGPEIIGPKAVTFFRFTGTDGVYGNAGGALRGRDIAFNVHWDDGKVSKYAGTIDDNGVAHGTAYDAKTPTSTATWDSNSPLVRVTPTPSL